MQCIYFLQQIALTILNKIPCHIFACYMQRQCPCRADKKKGRNCGSCPLIIPYASRLWRKALNGLLFFRYFAFFLYSIVDQVIVKPDQARVLIVLINPVTNHADCACQNEEAVQ